MLIFEIPGKAAKIYFEISRENCREISARLGRVRLPNIMLYAIAAAAFGFATGEAIKLALELLAK